MILRGLIFITMVYVVVMMVMDVCDMMMVYDCVLKELCLTLIFAGGIAFWCEKLWFFVFDCNGLLVRQGMISWWCRLLSCIDINIDVYRRDRGRHSKLLYIIDTTATFIVICCLVSRGLRVNRVFLNTHRVILGCVVFKLVAFYAAIFGFSIVVRIFSLWALSLRDKCGLMRWLQGCQTSSCYCCHIVWLS